MHDPSHHFDCVRFLTYVFRVSAKTRGVDDAFVYYLQTVYLQTVYFLSLFFWRKLNDFDLSCLNLPGGLSLVLQGRYGHVYEFGPFVRQMSASDGATVRCMDVRLV